MLSPILLVLGLFRMAASIHIGGATLVDTLAIVVVIYAAFNYIAFAVWMLAAYFLGTIPVELEEAAWIDGANRLQSVLRIFLPLSLPAIAVTGLVTFVGSWNEFVVALTMLRRSVASDLAAEGPSTLWPAATPVEWNQVMAATLLGNAAGGGGVCGLAAISGAGVDVGRGEVGALCERRRPATASGVDRGHPTAAAGRVLPVTRMDHNRPESE